MGRPLDAELAEVGDCFENRQHLAFCFVIPTSDSSPDVVRLGDDVARLGACGEASAVGEQVEPHRIFALTCPPEYLHNVSAPPQDSLADLHPDTTSLVSTAITWPCASG
eukprot:1699608-Rhodomonas_salina.7